MDYSYGGGVPIDLVVSHVAVVALLFGSWYGKEGQEVGGGVWQIFVDSCRGVIKLVWANNLVLLRFLLSLGLILRPKLYVSFCISQ